MLYSDHKAWEMAWKRPWGPDSSEFIGLKGKVSREADEWFAEVTERNRDGGGFVYIGGRGPSVAEAVHDCWENRLNYFAPKDVYEHVLLLKARNAFPAKYGHWVIKGWDDQDEEEGE